MAINQRDEKLNLIFGQEGAEDILKLSSALDEVAKSGSDLAPQAQALLDQLNKLSDQSVLISNFIELKAKLGDVDDQLKQAVAGQEALNAEFDRSDTSSKKVTASFASADAAVAGLTARHNALTAQVTSAGNALAAAGVDTQHLDSAQRSIQQSITDTTAKGAELTIGMKAVGEAHHEAGEKAQEASTLFEFVKEHLKEIISVATAVELALKGIEFGEEGLKDAEAIQASLSRVQAVAKGTAEEFAKMDEGIEAAAETVNVSSQSAATGLNALAKGGLSAKDALTALVPTLQLAKIANTDVSTAADSVSKTLDAFKLPASDAQHIVDLLAASSHGAAGGLASISNAVVQLAPDAKALGLTIDQVVGVVGLLANNGLDGEKSLRGLRAVFQDLQNPASALRVQLFGLGDGSNSFTAAVKALTSGSPQANQALLTLDGSARTVIQALGQQGPDAIDKFTASLEKQNGAAATMVKTIDDNTSGALSRFGFAVEKVASDLAKPLLKPLQDELIVLSGKLDDLVKSGQFDKIKDQIAKFAKDASAALNKLIDGIDWDTFGDKAVGALQDAVDTADKLAKSAEAIATAINKVGEVAGAIYNTAAVPVNALKAGVVEAGAIVTKTAGAIVGEIEDLEGKSKDTSQAVNKLGDSLQDMASAAGKDAVGNVKALLDDVTALAPKTGAAAAATDAFAGAHARAGAAAKEHAAAEEQVSPAVAKLATAIPSVPLVPFAEQLQKAADTLNYFKDEAGKPLDPIKALGTAFTVLHVNSQQALEQTAKDAAAAFALIDKSGANTAEGLADRRTAFLAMAQAVLAASQNLDQGTRDSIVYQLQSKAAALDVSGAFDKMKSSSDAARKSIVDDVSSVTDSLINQAVAAQNAAIDLSGAAAAADKYADAMAKLGDHSVSSADKAQAANDAIANAANDTQKNIAEIAKSALSDFNVGEDYIASFTTSFSGLSDAAIQAYNNVQKSAITAISGLSAFAQEYAAIMDEGNKRINADISQQQTEVAQLTGYYAGLSQTVKASANDTADSLQKRADALALFSQQVKANTGDFKYLDQQTLDQLGAQVDAVQQKVQALADAAKAAKQQFEDLAQQAQDALDEADGNQAAIEDRRYQQQLADLKAAAAAANELNSQVYLNAVAAANALHAKNLANIKSEADAKNNPNGVDTSGGSGGGTSAGASSSGSTSAGSSSAASGSAGAGTNRLDVVVSGSLAGSFNENDPNHARLVASISKAVVGQIVKSYRNAGRL